MKRKLVVLTKTALAMVLLVLSVLGTVVSAQAALIEINNSSGHVIYDDVAQKYGVWKLNDFTGKTYAEQIAMIQTNYATPQYFGLSNWHMATATEMAGLWTYGLNDLGKFNFTLEWASNNHFWLGRYDAIMSPGNRHATAAFQIGQFSGQTNKYALPYPPTNFNDSTTNDSIDGIGSAGAWVVASAAVPEPATMLLFGFGLAGLAGLRRFKK